MFLHVVTRVNKENLLAMFHKLVEIHNFLNVSVWIRLRRRHRSQKATLGRFKSGQNIFLKESATCCNS